METQTLKIEIPKGHEIESFDQKSGVIKFRETPKSITERIRTVEDVLNDHGLTQEEFDEECDGMQDDEKAYKLLKFLALSLNQGWTPNWKDSNEYKYVCWFEMDSSSGFRFHDYVRWHTFSSVGSRLCFKTRELAQHAGKHFLDVWKQYMIIN